MPIPNAGSDLPSFFARAQANNQPGGVLINTQVDPTLPEATALTRITDPVIADTHFSELVRNFDPDLYDLRPTSHLMRLVKALTGGAGVGGIKKQITNARLVGTLAITAFADLDSFYGALFNFNRYSIESMPLNSDGSAALNPYTDVATPESWDDAKSRDARYRSRVFQVARAINMGGSISGIKGVAEALLSCEVDVIESWQHADYLNNNSTLVLPSGLTFGNIEAQYRAYGQFKQTYNFAQGGRFGAGVSPDGTRNEVILTPRRLITNEEKLQLQKVLRTVRPSHTQITLGAVLNQATRNIPARKLLSDSEDWDVLPRVTLSSNLNQPNDPLYANAGSYSVARPVNSEYTGEAWTYNPNVVKTYSYRLVNNQPTSTDSTETITYQDQTSHVYAPGDAVMDPRQALGERLSGDGVVTTFPYQGLRQTVNS